MTAQPDEHTQVSRDPNPAPQAGCAKEGIARLNQLYEQCRVAQRPGYSGFDDAAWGKFDAAIRRAWPSISAQLSASPPLPVAEREWQEERAHMREALERIRDFPYVGAQDSHAIISIACDGLEAPPLLAEQGPEAK